LRYVLNHIAAAKEAAYYIEDPRAVTANQYLESVVVAGEAAADQLIVARVASRLAEPNLIVVLKVGDRRRVRVIKLMEAIGLGLTFMLTSQTLPGRLTFLLVPLSGRREWS
jgi:hypothetical protein